MPVGRPVNEAVNWSDGAKLKLLSAVVACSSNISTIPQLTKIFEAEGWSAGAIQKTFYKLKKDGEQLVERSQERSRQDCTRRQQPKTPQSSSKQPKTPQSGSRKRKEPASVRKVKEEEYDRDFEIVSFKRVNAPLTPQQTPKAQRIRQSNTRSTAGKRKRWDDSIRGLAPINFDLEYPPTPSKTPSKRPKQNASMLQKLSNENEHQKEESESPNTQICKNGVTDDVVFNAGRGNLFFDFEEASGTDEDAGAQLQLQPDAGVGFVTFIGDEMVDVGFQPEPHNPFL